MDYNTLLEEAKKASQNAYAVYSKFPVGACVLYESGNTYTGCNVENASYGLSICAERNAMSTAIARGEKSQIKAIAIYSPNQKQCFPCGACRQWLSEFAPDIDVEIVLESDEPESNSQILILKLKDIFPNVFRFN